MNKRAGVSYKKIIALSLAMMLVTPLLAQAPGAQQACSRAQMDAERDVNGTLWLGIGFLFTFPLGWPLLPMMIEPSPSASRYVGKSPEYIAAYTDCYKSAAKKIQQNKALTGCIIGTLAEIGCWGCYFGLIAASASSY